MGFSRQEYWSWLPCPPPEDLPNPEIESMSLMSPALAGGFFTSSTTGEGQSKLTTIILGNIIIIMFNKQKATENV